MENTQKLGIVFDCDGTLLDSLGMWYELEQELSRRAGCELTKSDRDAITTFTIPETGAFMHEKFGLGKSAEDVVQMMNDFLLDYYRLQVNEKPGALSFVRALRERGVVMSVASSSPQSYLQAGLAHAGFSPYLEAIVSVDDVGASKREPAVYDHARMRMGTSLESTWVFEDASYALRTVRAAGYRAVGVYDCDESGTMADLESLANVVITNYESFSADDFIQLAAS